MWALFWAHINTMNDYIQVVIDDPQWPKYIKDPKLKQIKRQISLNIK